MSARNDPTTVLEKLDPERCASEMPAERRAIESTQLLAGGKELLIRHGSEIYTLRQTSKGKLILTK